MATILQSPKRTTRAVIPRPGESQPAFAIRYHESMKTRIPDTDARNRAMFAAWDRHGETDDCEKIARKNFPESKFVRVTNVPYLQEHSIKREDGETDVYDRNRLAQMVQANNHRAADVGLFAPLSEGHTPEDSTVTSPPVLGYAGCYRLGMIGRKRPRWCIFANEFHFRDDAERLRKMARRSPEVWEDGTIDPVAVLGSITPRLDMGMTRFCRDRSGQRVRRYAALPAASNVYAPRFGGGKPKRFSAGADMALSQEDLSQIVEAVLDAVNNTDHFQWVEDQMRGAAKSSANDHDEEPEDYERDDEDEDDIDDDFGEGLDDGDLDGDDLDTLTEEELSEMDDEERTDYDSLDDDDKVIYAKGRRGRHRRKTRPRKLSRQTRTERYSRQHAKRNGKVADSRAVQSLQRQVENLERERRHAERYARLRELQGAGYQFELDDEFQEVKNLDDAGWQRHQRQVEKYSRVPVANGFMPVGDLPVQRGAKPDKYAKERAAKAVQIAQRDGIPYKDALEKARAEAGE